MKIAEFPNEIQHRILSYLIYAKDPLFLHDIRNYVTTLPKILEYYHEIYIILHPDPQDFNDLRWLSSDICAYMNDFYPRCLGYRPRCLDICRRSFQFHYYTDDEIIAVVDRIKPNGKYGFTRFTRQLYAILTPEERADFIGSLRRIYDIIL